MGNPLLHLARFFHRFPWARRIARLVAARRTITQPFHGGTICLNAVEHSWAWTGDRTLANFDRFLQQRLIDLTATRPRLVDVGCNIGVMTLSVLLNRPAVTAVALDPNRQAIDLLNRSLARNRLSHRAQTVLAALSVDARSVAYAPGGSFTGHLTGEGTTKVPGLPLAELVRRHVTGRTVVKIDIEGYEAVLADSFRRLPRLPGTVIVIEVHPLGFNGMGDPEKFLAAVRSLDGVTLRQVDGRAVAALDPTQFHHLELHWPDE